MAPPPPVPPVPPPCILTLLVLLPLLLLLLWLWIWLWFWTTVVAAPLPKLDISIESIFSMLMNGFAYVQLWFRVWKTPQQTLNMVGRNFGSASDEIQIFVVGYYDDRAHTPRAMKNTFATHAFSRGTIILLLFWILNLVRVVASNTIWAWHYRYITTTTTTALFVIDVPYRRMRLWWWCWYLTWFQFYAAQSWLASVVLVLRVQLRYNCRSWFIQCCLVVLVVVCFECQCGTIKCIFPIVQQQQVSNDDNGSYCLCRQLLSQW